MVVKNSKHRFIGVIDLGTTSVRFTAFDLEGKVVAIRQKAISQQYPFPGWVEEKPMEILDLTEQSVRETLNEEPKIKENLEGLGICNQRESVMLWDKNTGEPLSELIVWQDRRTADRCRELEKAGLSSLIKEKTGLTTDPYFSATKIEWLLKNSPAYKDRRKEKNISCGTLDSWIIFRLTGNHLTDISNASRTMLFNINDPGWDSGLIDIFGIPLWVLPEVKPSFGKAVFGYTSSNSVFGGKIPLCCVMGDQQASLFGHRCFEKGQTKCTFGTGSFLISNTGDTRFDSKNGLISTIFYKEEHKRAYYALEGSIYNSGSILKWLKEDLGLIGNYDEIDKMASTVDYQSRMYIVPAMTGLGAPYWDPDAGALLIGFERSTSSAGIVRAALEAIAYRTGDIITAMEKDTGTRISEIRIDGGVSRSRLFCQIFADLTGKMTKRSSRRRRLPWVSFLESALQQLMGFRKRY